MKIEIKNKFGNVIVTGKYESFLDALIKNRANLSCANLSGANLSCANLSGADLSGANLSHANLSGATGINKILTSHLYGMFEQGLITGYKLVNNNYEGPFSGGLVYKVGTTVMVNDANTDELIQCGSGINIASLDWCARNYVENKGMMILKVTHTPKDVAAIPIGSDGKYRVHRCRVVSKMDLKKLGLEK